MSESQQPSDVKQPSAAIRQAIAGGSLPVGTDASDLGMVEKRGPYAGREVTYFRVFDPRLAARQGIEIRGFDDLDDHLDLVLRAGHIEDDGGVSLGPGFPIGVRRPPHLPGDR